MDWWRFNAADYEVGGHLYIEDGYSDRTVVEYVVTRITPSGQVAATRKLGDARDIEIRVTSSGRIVGAGRWDRRRPVSRERAAEVHDEETDRTAWRRIRATAEAVDKAARKRDLAALKAALSDLSSAAQAIEAQRAETVKQGSVADESAVAESDAPNSEHGSSPSIEVPE